MNVTRRDFLKWSGASVAALAALPAFDKAALAEFLGSENQAEQFGMLIDTTRCIGCRACQAACKQKNGLPPDTRYMPELETFPRELSASTYSLVEFHKVEGSPPRIQPIKRQCMHCLEPACASVCPVAAIVKTPKGPVVYDADRCIGCRYCMAACPFNIPKYEWDSANPQIRKCNMCADRIEAGEMPACVQACPTGALQFGTRRDLVAEAQARIRNNPSNYVPYIYGLSEVGGTSVLYLANVPFDQLGLPTDLPKHPLPDLTWQVMEKIPIVAVGVGLLMAGASWLTRVRKAPSDLSRGRNVEHTVEGVAEH